MTADVLNNIVECLKEHGMNFLANLFKQDYKIVYL